MPVIKKSKSDYNVNNLDSIASWNKTDTSKFPIPKKTKFAARGFAIICAIFYLALSARVTPEILTARNLRSVHVGAHILNIFSLPIALSLIGFHYYPHIQRKWSSKKILIVELIADFLVTLSFLAVLIGYLNQGSCPGIVDGCGAVNWGIVFICFTLVFWIVPTFIDAKSLYSGLNPEPVDLNELARINRQMARQ
ncbi:hypothetical protein BKA69DRAFT_8750 [Paraphysoderma sedebokerense]|nr:hypothetical protein BKA69DRAFT_8750 [Paraphysoderma sedebokerense]